MLNNPNLEKEIHYMLIKPLREPIEINDLLRVKKIILTPNNINQLLASATAIDLEKLSNVSSISLEQLPITEEIVSMINHKESLQSIYIGHCQLQTNQQLSLPVDSVSLNSVDVKMLELFGQPQTISKMTLLRVRELDMEKLARFSDVKNLSICRCNVIHTSYINQLTKLKQLQIEGTNFDHQESLGYLRDEVIIHQRVNYDNDMIEID